ncbi:polyprenyl synthetase family protein [Coprobacillus sp. AF34-1BH]|uniref:polyprenyl synthetase family protein n=1 Tax=Faecalibacillus faecis TaxID=1982628 RepID=UPI000E53DAA7|nr:farnesyl diphosphate synthase [Faecalibacillus faecis]RGT63600.1 polyprenyl synthetase family protein [Coprobacillus sp. AF18-40]RGT85664.1 polyprenyl synthetase family protein [Coprobacillus sp. AF18-15LB]RHB06409.1 polyprenyl synthetase family protein [Coprobacillus sp. AM42-12AC]RHP28348.1 polyprenyl synthetase family protein [Coprobacillus sp. AF34-1BH]
MNNIVNEINQRLKTILNDYPKSKVKEAMLYSLQAGGKRIRPFIVLQVIRAYNQNYHDYIDIACALEMIHTYSLIHDDLPGMDNDDLRRGKPTCHKQFGEATAILAGDGLLNEAVNIIVKTSLASDLKIALISCLYQASGISGMIYGQELDIENENKKLSIDKLNTIHHYKTGKLLSCAFQLGGLIASPQDVKVLKEIGYKVGLAFQIQDDILDVISDSKTLGKPVGSDASNHKETYTTLIGVEASQKEVDKLFKEAIELVYSLSINHGLIIEIIELLWKRVS